jgi:hypothetical protein
MRLLHAIANHLKTFRRDHEGLLDLHLFGVDVNGKGVIFDFIFLIFEELLKMLVVLCSQRNHHTRLSLFLILFGNSVKVLFIHHHLELRRWLILLDLLLLGDEDNLREVFDGIGDDVVDELIIDPKEADLQSLIGSCPCFSCDFCGGGSESREVGCYNFVDGFPFSLHLSEDHLVALSLFDDLSVLIEEMHLTHLDLLGGVHLEHITVVVLHQPKLLNIISLQV